MNVGTHVRITRSAFAEHVGQPGRIAAYDKCKPLPVEGKGQHVKVLVGTTKQPLYTWEVYLEVVGSQPKEVRRKA